MSFSEYYKKWKEDNNITEEKQYNPNTTQADIDSTVDDVANRKIETITNRLQQIRNNNNTQNQEQSIWNRVQDTKNGMSFNLSQNTQNEIQQKLAQFKNQGATVNQNGKSITQRETTNKLKLPEVQIANKQYEEQKNNKQIESAEKLINDFKAQKTAEEINENIQKGGADAVNATIENTLNNFSEGVLGAVSGIANVPIMLGAGALDVVEKIIPNANGDIKNNLLNEANRIGNKFTKYTNANPYIENDAVKTTGSVSNTIGNMIPSIVSNIIVPGSGVFVQGASAGGKTAQESVNADRDNIGQAITKGIGYGTASGLIEKLTGGNILGKGSLDDFATNFIGNKISSKLGQKIASKGYEFLGENLEEFLENQVDHAIDYAIEGKGVTKEEWINEFNETNKNTLLTTAVLNLLGLGGNTYQEIQNNPNIDQNTKQAVKEVNEAIDKNKLGGKEQLEQFINNKIDNNTAELQQQSTQSEQILPTQQITQEQNNVAQNGNTEQINNYTTDEFKKGIEKFNSKKYNQKDNIQVLNELPQYFYNLGYEINSPLYLNMNKLENIMKEPKGNFQGKNQHGITMDIVEELPRAISNPLNVIKNPKFNNRFVVVTDLTDQYGDIVVVPLEINSSSNVAEVTGINKISSIYGKETYDLPKSDNLPSYMEQNKDNIVYDIDNNKSSTDNYRLQLPSNINTASINNSIPPINNKVNSDTITNNYAQSNENNTQNEKKPTRHEVIQENREIARENIKNISKWKDKKRGLSYQLETMERNMYDIIPDKEEAQRINDTYFNPIHESEAEKQRFINKYNDRIKEFNLNKYESEAVQLLGEQKYNPDFKAQEVQEILDKVNNNIEKGKIDVQKVNEAIETFRNIYDELFEIENKALMENGYKEKPYRKGYFPHFIDYVPETKTEKILNKLGFKIDKRPLPTDIAGITEQFIPGKTWNKSSLERKGNKTDYNALKGFDTYIAQASDNIFHTENIQRLRGLENEIRYQYSDKGIQERIDKIVNDETLYEDEKQNLIDQILEQTNNPMPNLVTELRRYTNALANKKSEADRSIENMMGRSVYSTVNAIENRFGANAVGLNIGSAFTNIIPITQAWSQVSTKNMGRAVIDTVKSYMNNDGFVDNSAFLTSRINQSEKLYKTSIEKISDKTSFLFNAIDEVTSNIVVRSKYLDNIQKGMSESEAIKNADQFARNVIADRSKGAIPTKFEEKNPITKAFTQFQLEVNNQYRYMFKDLPRDLKEKGLGSIALAFFKMFVGAWLYNEASEKVTGRRPAFDPIDIATSAYKDITDEKKGTYDKIASIGKNVAEELPFVGGLVGGGRIPVNGAIPDVGNLTKAGIGLATGEMDSNKAISNIGKEVAKPLYYLLPPFGGAQIKKSTEGISTIANGGSYGVDSKGKETLQFPVENPDAMDYIKAGIFGKYALPLAKEYTDNNFKSLNANQTKTYKESKIPYKEYLEYLNQDLKKNEDKITYINKQKWGENQKWGIYTNELFSDEKRKDGGSQLEDANYAIKNGTSKAEYMKLYEETNKRSMNLPTQDEQEELKEKGISLKNFVDYQTKVHDETKKRKENGTLDENKQLKNKDKIEILVNSNYDSKTKSVIYSNGTGKDDNLYNNIKNSNIDINEYLKYKIQDSNGKFSADKDSNGKSISGTAKEKIYNYVNSNITGYNNKLLILGSKYKLSRSEQEKLANYIYQISTSVEDKNNLFDYYSKNFTINNGKVYYK